MTCQKKFKRPFRYVKEKILNGFKVKYCSKKCQPRFKKTKRKISCTYCNTKFEKIPSQIQKNNFCSQSCAAKYNNKRRKRKNPKNRCLSCGKKINRYGLKYCNRNCYILYKFKKVEKEFQRTGSFPTDKYGQSDISKKYLIWKNGHKCSICKKTIWNKKPIPLIFDHIDGDSSNWKKENCRLICPNCDHQQPTFAGRNRHKAIETLRSKRRKDRYRKLKENHILGARINY